ncbi:thermonuclease family protein [Nitratidesulfovibrio vulgaris]|uniref:Nuclease, putative n=1 Tax=Nitratidesulfovibrio vulgaris (strain ATCC 29579 / DSM 644 / CCUG 34227 / NCIMB 8303 / VKM B-1760 / Hildenborough) TaxID=882 RepID=Q72AI6_NITV2|nr:thermonuclease family protein [Nitratidesulfovibrio vulgaris]AAS96482.1 nuclease, putative [Nitratidesulfovibrio vulgaris str. Hildenborough]ADP86468.1 nuclease (SNase domain-containing protein) [Nitratidesulfovibrio vulgaris RCH1]
MKRLFVFMFFVCLSSFLLLISQDASAWEGKVVGVADGDTVTVLSKNNDQIRIRLYGIDAPESAQAFGAKAKQSLANMVFGKVVRVEEKDRDRYGRVVARLYVGSLDVNAEQIRQGMAWVYRHYCRDGFCSGWIGLAAC